MNKKSTWSEILFMFVLSLICAVLLGGTRAAIGERAELSERTVSAVYEIIKNSEVSCACEVGRASEVAGAVKFASQVEGKDKFNNCKDSDDEYKRFLNEFKLVYKGRIKYWKNASDSAMLACEATGSGMWNEITIVFVYDTSKQKIMGLRVTEQNETAGVGSRITEEEFYSQFTDFLLDAVASANKKEGPDVKVDAITGATTSSRAVEKLLEKALRGLP